MRSVTLVTLLLLCSFSWISVSASEFYTVEVQSGKQVTLMCSNFSSSPTQIIWFRAVKKLNPRCVCFLFKHSEPASYCDGFNNLTFEATSNISTIFLKIKRVHLSDSGLYFCGFYLSANTVIVDATYLEVQDVFDGIATPLTFILLGMVAFLIIVIAGLVVKIKTLQKADIENQKTEDSDYLNYAQLSFRPHSNRNPRRAAKNI